MRNAVTALLLVLLSTASCSGGPTTAAPDASPQHPATRDRFDIRCFANDGFGAKYGSLVEAWRASEKAPFTNCTAELKRGESQVQLTEDDRKATSIIEWGDTTDVYGFILETCAEWNPESAGLDLDKAGYRRLQAALLVCPDSPYIDGMRAALSRQTEPSGWDLVTPTPTATVTAPPLPTTKTVTYVIEADGPIGLITYTNYIERQIGQEQTTNEVNGPVKKTYTFPASAFFEGTSFSLGVIAQGSGSTTSITCRILLEGHELTKQTSSGPYAAVSCNYTG